MNFNERLQQVMPDAEERPQQEELYLAISASLAAGRHCLAEAGTGVGKTLAYLLPLLERIIEGGKGVISTFTINLQSQLVEKDLPLALAAMGCGEIKWALLKGRSNYLCLRRLSSEMDMWGKDDPLLGRLWEWAALTATGDRAELGFECSSWQAVASDRDGCRGNACPHHRKCFFLKARRKASEADLCVVNHALFFTDMSWKLREGESDIIPDFDVIVFDEAHHLEETAVKALSTSASLAEGRVLLSRLLKISAGTEVAGLVNAGDMLLSRIFTPFIRYAKETGRENFFFSDIGYDNGALPCEGLTELEMQVEELERLIAAEGTPALAQQSEAYTAALRAYLGRLAEIMAGCDEGEFRWGECSRRRDDAGCVIYLSPVRIGPMLRTNLFDQVQSAVLTSATLSALGSFHYIREALGLADKADEVMVGSPFDYHGQAVLYLGRGMDPSAADPHYHRRLAEEIKSILEVSQGRAFVLFTSYRALTAVRKILGDKLPWPLFYQGDMSNERLLESFRATPGACLLGTQSFWEGVDMPGDGLVCVIIDRLPFSPPDDPLHRARVEEIKSGNGNWFMEYALPRAQIKLKQGLGRLIRSHSDRGIMAILDNRILSRAYGRHMLQDLPDCTRVTSLEELASRAEDIFGREQ